MSSDSVSISILEPQDLPSWDSFARTQYAAFAGNNLHDYVYPLSGLAGPSDGDIAHTVARHRDAAQDGLNKSGEEVVFVVARKDTTGEVLAGVKWCFYEDDNKAHDATVEVGWYDKDSVMGKRAQRVLDDFLGRRAEKMKGRHAGMSLLFHAVHTYTLPRPTVVPATRHRLHVDRVRKLSTFSSSHPLPGGTGLAVDSSNGDAGARTRSTWLRTLRHRRRARRCTRDTASRLQKWPSFGPRRTTKLSSRRATRSWKEQRGSIDV